MDMVLTFATRIGRGWRRPDQRVADGLRYQSLGGGGELV